jgi:hypothetical protein
MSSLKDIVPHPVLTGWKEIANHLGKGVRTVQRYERQLALPVHRPAGKPWGSVMATESELDAWVSASPIREAVRIAKAMVASECCNSSSDLKEALAEMRELRDEMKHLRAKLRTTVQSLSRQVQAMREQLNADNGHEIELSFNAADDGLGTKDLLNLLCFPTRIENRVNPEKSGVQNL